LLLLHALQLLPHVKALDSSQQAGGSMHSGCTLVCTAEVMNK
jgi:hypothetical protein